VSSRRLIALAVAPAALVLSLGPLEREAFA
jgi:hypothetical protein